MSGNFGRHNPLTLGLLVVTALLVLIIVAELYPTNGNPAQGDIATQTERNDVSNMSPQNLPPPSFDNYTEIVARPLFNQGRRPSDGTENGSATQDDPLHLTGIVITPERREALFLSRQNKEVVRALIGEWVEGWKVDAIEPERVTVHRDGRTAEIVLERGSSSIPAGKSQVKPGAVKK